MFRYVSPSNILAYWRYMVLWSLVNKGSGNGVSPVRRQFTAWSKEDPLSIVASETKSVKFKYKFGFFHWQNALWNAICKIAAILFSRLFMVLKGWQNNDRLLTLPYSLPYVSYFNGLSGSYEELLVKRFLIFVEMLRKTFLYIYYDNHALIIRCVSHKCAFSS